MPAPPLGRRDVTTVAPTATVADLARSMKSSDVGCVLVVEHEIPIGIVTDRDLVLRVLAGGLDPQETTARAVMSSPLVTLPVEHDAVEAAARMREKRIRRLPIVDGAERLVGILTLDDLVCRVGRAGADLADTIAPVPVPHFGG